MIDYPIKEFNEAINLAMKSQEKISSNGYEVNLVRKIMEQDICLPIKDDLKFVDFLIKHINIECERYWNRNTKPTWGEQHVAYEEARTLRMMFTQLGSFASLRDEFYSILKECLLKVETQNKS